MKIRKMSRRDMLKGTAALLAGSALSTRVLAIRLTYNGNGDWVYPTPLSFLQSCHSLGGVKSSCAGQTWP